MRCKCTQKLPVMKMFGEKVKSFFETLSLQNRQEGMYVE